MKKHFIQMNNFSNAYIGVNGDEEKVNLFLEMVASNNFATELSMFDDLDNSVEYDECAEEGIEPEKVYPVRFKEPILGSFSYENGLTSIMNFVNDQIHDAVKPNIEIGIEDYRHCGDIFKNISEIAETEPPTVINTMMTTAKSGWRKVKWREKLDLFTKDGEYYKTEEFNKTKKMFIIPFLIRHEHVGKDTVKEEFAKVKELLNLYTELIDGIKIYLSTSSEPTFYEEEFDENDTSSIHMIEYDTDSMIDDAAFAVYSANKMYAALRFINVRDAYNEDNESFCRFII